MSSELAPQYPEPKVYMYLGRRIVAYTEQAEHYAQELGAELLQTEDKLC